MPPARSRTVSTIPGLPERRHTATGAHTMRSRACALQTRIQPSNATPGSGDRPWPRQNPASRSFRVIRVFCETFVLSARLKRPSDVDRPCRLACFGPPVARRLLRAFPAPAPGFWIALLAASPATGALGPGRSGEAQRRSRQQLPCPRARPWRFVVAAPLQRRVASPRTALGTGGLARDPTRAPRGGAWTVDPSPGLPRRAGASSPIARS